MEDDSSLLERHIQSFLESNLNSLGEHLSLVAKEHPVPFGRIDLLARDASNNLVAIELKLGSAGRDAIGQLQSYMGALKEEEPDVFVRGILVAASLDPGAEAAFRVARDIMFISYEVTFSFRQMSISESTYEAWIDRRKPKKTEAAQSILWLPPSFER